jgi:hypothetical protein
MCQVLLLEDQKENQPQLGFFGLRPAGCLIALSGLSVNTMRAPPCPLLDKREAVGKFKIVTVNEVFHVSSMRLARNIRITTLVCQRFGLRFGLRGHKEILIPYTAV